MIIIIEFMLVFIATLQERGLDVDGAGDAVLREMGGAPRNPAPRNHVSAGIAKPSVTQF